MNLSLDLNEVRRRRAWLWLYRVLHWTSMVPGLRWVELALRRRALWFLRGGVAPVAPLPDIDRRRRRRKDIDHGEED